MSKYNHMICFEHVKRNPIYNYKIETCTHLNRYHTVKCRGEQSFCNDITVTIYYDGAFCICLLHRFIFGTEIKLLQNGEKTDTFVNCNKMFSFCRVKDVLIVFSSWLDKDREDLDSSFNTKKKKKHEISLIMKRL